MKLIWYLYAKAAAEQIQNPKSPKTFSNNPQNKQ